MQFLQLPDRGTSPYADSLGQPTLEDTHATGRTGSRRSAPGVDGTDKAPHKNPARIPPINKIDIDFHGQKLLTLIPFAV
jgi:hypothetical protein